MASNSGCRSFGRDGQVGRGDALPAGGVDDREVERRVVGAQLDEQVEDGVEHLGEPGVGAVDLVDDDDRPQPVLERLAEHEARLRQRPLGGIDEQEARRRPSCRTRSTSPPKSAWPGVSMRLTLTSPSVKAMFLARMVMPRSRSRSLESRIRPCCPPASLSSSSAEQAGLAQHLIDQGGLAVVDVGDDGDVADVVPAHRVVV